MSDIEPGLESVPTPERPPVAIREGLPTAYRMRADAHYVEQLDAPASPSVRLIDARTIEVRGEDPRPAASFVESIKRHGVLQPILVQTRGGRYRLIAGRKRLAAAISAGLREVPCLVQRVDEEQAGQLAEATNLPAQDAGAAAPAAAATPPAPLRPVPPVERGAGATDQLAQSLLALASSANLLSGGSPLTVAVAADLVRAEAARALQLLLASRVLRDEVPVSRLKVPVRTVIDRAMQITLAERRLRATEVLVLADGVRDAAVRGDEELLASALAGLMMATVGLIGEKGGPTTLSASVKDGRVTFAVAQESLSVPESWVERSFETAWPIANAATGTLALMQSARRIAELHAGAVSAASIESGTSFNLTLPALAREM
ncbi:MAG TPA: ParB N-terminal domain-containing protein [Vicinamibacterales bacterium]|jgi:ParB-like chromosome segregation protein Spo0J|nr:ParB N-terminal domain-containing protein [Vicinamibacterales bacterium]